MFNFSLLSVGFAYYILPTRAAGHPISTCRIVIFTTYFIYAIMQLTTDRDHLEIELDKAKKWENEWTKSGKNFLTILASTLL